MRDCPIYRKDPLLARLRNALRLRLGLQSLGLAHKDSLLLLMIQGVLKKEDESIAPLFMGRF
jgi:hypothetical protein